MTDRIDSRALLLALATVWIPAGLAQAAGASEDADPAGGRVLTGREALGDWMTDAPGVRRRITPDDLSEPYETRSARNFPRIVPRQDRAWPRAPRGFRVSEFAT